MSSRYSEYVAKEKADKAGVCFFKTMRYLMENLDVQTCLVTWVKQRCDKMPPPGLVL